MTYTEIYLLHRQLYEYLKSLYEARPNTCFWLLNLEQALALQNGLWFSEADEKILSTILEEGFQGYQLRIEYHLNTQNWHCSVETFASDSFIQRLQSLGFAPTVEQRWEKILPNSTHFLEKLEQFFQYEKLILEAGLEKQPLSSAKRLRFKQGMERIDQFYQRTYICEYHRLITASPKKALPFAISRLEVIDYQGITNLVIENIPTEKQWIFLTGENGFGKTSILKAIAKALAGDEDFVASLPNESRLNINGYQRNQPFYYEAKPRQLPKRAFPVATYGISRFQVSKIDPSEFSSSRFFKKTYSLFNDDGLLMNIDRFLMDKERDDLPTFQQLKKFFLKIIPNLADIKSIFDVISKNRRIQYYEKSDNGERYAPVHLSELAAGYRGILTLICDMVQRLSEYSENTLSDLKGIVLIDEFDAHLHPKYQYELPNLLSKVFPKIQFIVATHSPMPILGAAPKTFAVLTVHRTKSKGITVERLDDDIDIQRLNVNALLTSDIFNFGDIFARGATPDTIEPFDKYSDIQKTYSNEKLLELKTRFKKLKIKI